MNKLKIKKPDLDCQPNQDKEKMGNSNQSATRLANKSTLRLLHKSNKNAEHKFSAQQMHKSGNEMSPKVYFILQIGSLTFLEKLDVTKAFSKFGNISFLR